MLNFIKAKRILGSQVIIGLVEDADVDFGGKVINFDRKYSALDADLYKTLSNEIRPYEMINLGLIDHQIS